MRHIGSATCPHDLRSELDRRQLLLDEDSTKVQDAWGLFRAVKAYEEVRLQLSVPLGLRRRCSYCSDSLAVDVEHFWPKTTFPHRAFVFENYMLICTVCNRKKSVKFPLDEGGLPLLVNPYQDDPWDVFFFDATTGLLDSRIERTVDGSLQRNSRAEQTLNILGEVLNGQPITSARKANWARLTDRLFAVLASEQALPSSRIELWRDDDDFGLGDYILDREGKEDPQLRSARNRFEERWTGLRDLPRAR